MKQTLNSQREQLLQRSDTKKAFIPCYCSLGPGMAQSIRVQRLGYRLDDRAISAQRSHIPLGLNQLPIQSIVGDISLGVRRPEGEADQSLPSSTKYE
jgi:hypothetical protein